MLILPVGTPGYKVLIIWGLGICALASFLIFKNIFNPLIIEPFTQVTAKLVDVNKTRAVFSDNTKIYECDNGRCVYPSLDKLKNNIGKVAELKLDKKGRISEIIINGTAILTVSNIQEAQKRGVLMAFVFFIIGASICLFSLFLYIFYIKPRQGRK